MANSTSGESVISRTMRVIDAFTTENTVLGVSEIAERSGLPLATAHRIVTELVAERVLERDNQRKIRMGTRLWEISQRASHEMSLRMAALPIMEDLQSIVKSHVQLAVISGGQVLYLERLSRRNAVVNLADPASRIPPYLCSAGLILLAYAPRDVQARVAEGPVVTRTPRSIRSSDELRGIIAASRRQGYAVAYGLMQPTAKGIAVPLFGEGGRIVAALSVVIPLEAEHLPIVPAMQAASRMISRGLEAHHMREDDVWHDSAGGSGSGSGSDRGSAEGSGAGPGSSRGTGQEG